MGQTTRMAADSGSPNTPASGVDSGVKKDARGRFRKGSKRPPGSGRTKGVPNKLAGDLRLAILEASELAGTTLAKRAAAKGESGHPTKLLGYLYHLALSEPRTMGALLKETLPKVQRHEGEITLTELVTGSWRREAEGLVDLDKRFPRPRIATGADGVN